MDTNNIDALYIGNNPVDKLYIGPDLVWEKEETPAGDYMEGFVPIELENEVDSIVETETDGVWTTEVTGGTRFTNYTLMIPVGGEVAVKCTEPTPRVAFGFKRTTSDADGGLIGATIYGVESGASGVLLRTGTALGEYIPTEPLLGKWLIVQRTTLSLITVFLADRYDRTELGTVDNSNYVDSPEIVFFGWTQLNRLVPYPQVKLP